MMILATFAAAGSRLTVDVVSEAPVVQLIAAVAAWVIVYAFGLVVSRHVRKDSREVLLIAGKVVGR